MLKGIERLLRKVYMGAQEHEISMHFLLLLKETGFPRKVNYWLTCLENRKLRKQPSEDMLKSQKFYAENRARVEFLSSILLMILSRWKMARSL